MQRFPQYTMSALKFPRARVHFGRHVHLKYHNLEMSPFAI